MVNPPVRPRRPVRRWPRVAVGLLGLGSAWLGPALWSGATAHAASVPEAPTKAAPDDLLWSSLTPSASPPPLSYASAVYDSDTQTVVLFGGRRSNGVLSNDTWVWDGSTWSEFPGSKIQAPPARELASMGFDPRLHQLILFGGRGVGGQLLDDTWAWNGAAWYNVIPQAGAPSPTAREAASVSYDGAGHLVMFGGVGATDSSVTPSTVPVPVTTSPSTGAPTSTSTTTTTAPPSFGPAQTGASDTTTTAPTAATATTSGPAQSVTSATPATPSATTTAASVKPVNLGDTWLWGPNGWEPSDATGPTPGGGAALAYDSTHRQLVLFVRSASASLKVTDTWLWRDGSWVQTRDATGPAPRTYGLLADSPPTHGLVLFGGSGIAKAGQVYGDTWLWNGSTWEHAIPSDSPAPRAGVAGTTDGASGRVVLFGGAGAGGSVFGDTDVLSVQKLVTIGPGTESTTTTPTSTAGSAQSSTAPAAQAKPTPTTQSEARPTVSPGTGAGTIPLVANSHVLHRGDLVRLTGTGFRAGTPITITFRSTPEVVGRTHANSVGTFSATVAVPDRAALGGHHFEAEGADRAGQATTLVAAVDVVGLGNSSATTTTQKVVMVLVALLLPLATWLALAGGSSWRRRRAAGASASASR